jgi:hypothetical protein
LIASCTARTSGWPIVTPFSAPWSGSERIITPRRGVEETVLTPDGQHSRVELPVAVAADRDGDARIVEVRMYYGSWRLTGRHTNRPPLLPGAGLEAPNVLWEHERALAAGDVEAVVAAFAPDASVREPAGGAYVHRGHEELVALYERFFSNGGGIPLERCSVTNDGHCCGLEYNLVPLGPERVAPEAGISVYVRGQTCKVASARL